jgi:hypothetical protein
MNRTRSRPWLCSRQAEAQILYRQLARGQWQPRFSSVQAQARWLIGKR